MEKIDSIRTFESWLEPCLNFERTPEKNIFWLDTMRFLCDRFSRPESFAPCFHVAGSKGKGSISALIASILDAAGFRTGLYTSPHILDFVERVSSAKGPFQKEVYDRAVREITEGMRSVSKKELPGEREVTWFEFATLFSFLVFRQAKVDYAVYEVGLGGRLDSTNVVSPICACIGPIELEHTEYLGDTIEKIAAEKGGVIKENSVAVIAGQRPSVRKIFETIAAGKNARIIFIDELIGNLSFRIKNISGGIPVMSVSFSSGIFARPIKTDMRLLGGFQAENAALAAVAVKTALPSITEDAIERGLAAASLPGRFEIIKKPSGFESVPFVVLDGAHTVSSVGFTMENMRRIFPSSPKILLFACAADKDAEGIAPLFKGEFDGIFLTRPGEAKRSDPRALAGAFDAAGLSYDCSDDYRTQIKNALGKAGEAGAPLLVTGSFYLVAEVKKILADFPSADIDPRDAF